MNENSPLDSVEQELLALRMEEDWPEGPPSDTDMFFMDECDQLTFSIIGGEYYLWGHVGMDILIVRVFPSLYSAMDFLKNYEESDHGRAYDLAPTLYTELALAVEHHEQSTHEYPTLFDPPARKNGGNVNHAVITTPPKPKPTVPGVIMVKRNKRRVAKHR